MYFEFGAGYGCMANIFSKINKKIYFKLFDTIPVNLIQYYYLKQNKLDVGFKKTNKFQLINNQNFKIFNKKKKKNLYSLLIGLYLKQNLNLEKNLSTF